MSVNPYDLYPTSGPPPEATGKISREEFYNILKKEKRHLRNWAHYPAARIVSKKMSINEAAVEIYEYLEEHVRILLRRAFKDE